MMASLARSVALVTAFSVGGCSFAVKHPAATVGITSFVLAEGMCEMATDGDHLQCAGISGGIGLGLAGVVLLALLLGGPGDQILLGKEGEVPPDEPLPVLEGEPGAQPAAVPVLAPPPAAPAPVPAPAPVEPAPVAPAPAPAPAL